jgi:hypothetical protein
MTERLEGGTDSRHKTHMFKKGLVNLEDIQLAVGRVENDLHRRFNADDVRQVQITIKEVGVHER